MSAFCPGFGAGFPGMATSRMALPTSAAILAPPPAFSASVASSLTASMLSSSSSSSSPPPPLPAGSFLDPRYPKGGFGGGGGGSGGATPLAARSLKPLGSGDAVGLLDISKHGGKEFLGRVEALLKAHRPLAQVVRFTKPTFNRPCPDALRAEVARKCSHVVVALAD